MEAVLLCDVLPDGTVAGVALVEPIYDTITGDRVSTRTVNPTTGAAYVPTGTLQPCASGSASSADCDAVTTPTATVGLCLADGTPIAVTVIRDCDGVVTSEGWINLTTGAFSAGTPPVGTVACGDSQSVQVSGTFCDIDGLGEVVGLVLIEYSYAADGTIDSVRLVDATTGTTYVPTGTVTVCPAGVEQPERDILQLCDTAADGTVTAFVRDYARDENGAIVGHSDYTLDGAAYAPTGTVGSCSVEPCRDSNTVQVCDVPADSSTGITPTIEDATVADVGQTQFQNHPGPYAPLWTGGTLVYPAGAGPAQEHLAAVGRVTADLAGCDGSSGTMTVSVRVTNDGPNPGQDWDGALRLFRGTTLLAADDALTFAPVGWQGTLTATVPVTAADIAAGDIYIGLMLETFHIDAKAWTADQFEVTLELEGCEATTSTQFLRTLVTDCETGEVIATVDTTLDGLPYTVTGEVGQCTATGGDATTCLDCLPLVLCDVPASGDPVPFLRTVCRDCVGTVVSTTDTDLDGTSPYAVTGTVANCAAGADVTTVEVVNTGVRSVTGTAAQDLATEFTGLQSVSLAVLASTVNVTMTDGSAVAIPAGVTLTWSVAKDTDSALDAASFVGADVSASYLLNWTYLS